MTGIAYNFPKQNIEKICICAEKEDMVHIYNCGTINQENKPNLKYLNGAIQKQIVVFQTKFGKREELINAHVILIGSAIFSNICSNG